MEIVIKISNNESTISSLMSIFAEMERARLGDRIKETKQLQKKENVYLGGPVPYGWMVTQVEDKQYLIKNKEQQKVIKIMKKLRDEGLSYRKISKELEEKHNVLLSHSGVSLILKDEEKQLTKFNKIKHKIKLKNGGCI